MPFRYSSNARGHKDADGMTNKASPDQIAEERPGQTAEEQSDLGLHYLHRPICLKI